MNNKIESVLKPIALRERSDGEHPLQALKIFAQTPRAEATATATRLSELFESIREFRELTYDKMLTNHSISRAKFPNEPLRLSAEEHTAFFSVVENLLELKKILTQSPATRLIPELRNLEDTLQRISMTFKVGNRDLSPRDAVAYHESNADKCRDALSKGTEKMADSILRAGDSLAFADRERLTSIISKLPGEKDAEGVYREHMQFNRSLVSWHRNIPREHPSYKVIQGLVNESSALCNHSRQTLEGFREAVAADRKFNVLFREIVTLIGIKPGIERDKKSIPDFTDTLREDFIRESVRASLAPQLDPTPKIRVTYDVRNRIPETLRAAAKDLGVGIHGDLVAVSTTGARVALVENVVPLIETADPSIFNGSKLRRHLAPVIRAAVKEARAVLTQREAEEELRLQRARESLEFVKMFFREELGASLPRDGSVQNALLTKFVGQYTDPTQIEARTKAIEGVVDKLQIPKNALSKNYSMYLLTEKEFARWSEQTQKLTSLVLRNFQDKATASLILNDPSTYLPNALPHMLETLQQNDASASSKR